MVKIRPAILAVTVVAILMGGIGVSSLLNLWNTTAAGGSGNGKGGRTAIAVPSDIRGSDTFGGISLSFNIPLEDLAQAFGVTGDAATFQCKQLEQIYTSLPNDVELGTESVKYFVYLYKALPYEDTPAYLPESAIRILKENAVNIPSQIEQISSNTVYLT